ncbi:MAG TPA: MFS transporter [Bacillota bacterium]
MPGGRAPDGAGTVAGTRPLRRAYLVLAALTLVVMAAVGFGRFAYTLVLPAMRDGLNLSRTHMGLLATGHLTAYLALALAGGLAVQRLGSLRVILIGLVLTGGGMIVTGTASDFGGALLGRVLTGFGSGAAYVPAAALVSAWFAARWRGTANGVIVAGNGLALATAGAWLPPLLGAGPDGWRSAWFALAAAVGLVALLAAALVRDRPSAAGPAPSGPRAPLPAALRWIGLAYTLWGGAYIIYATFFAAALVEGRGLSEAEAGGLWAAAGTVSIVSGVLAGAVSDRWGRPRALAAVLAVQAAAFAALALGQGMGWYRLSAILYGLTAWSVPSLVAAAAGDHAGPSRAAAALGVLTVGCGLGQAVGPGIGGLLIDRSGAYEPALLLAAGACLLAAAGAGRAHRPGSFTMAGR